MKKKNEKSLIELLESGEDITLNCKPFSEKELKKIVEKLKKKRRKVDEEFKVDWQDLKSIVFGPVRRY